MKRFWRNAAGAVLIAVVAVAVGNTILAVAYVLAGVIR